MAFFDKSKSVNDKLYYFSRSYLRLGIAITTRVTCPVSMMSYLTITWRSFKTESCGISNHLQIKEIRFKSNIFYLARSIARRVE